jgi:hypothetical protein
MQVTVALIIFNRPALTARVFEAIRKARPPKLLVVADGPRPNQPGEAEKCAAARAIIEKVDWPCEVLKNYSDTNLGCKLRPSSGLDWVFQSVPEAIILEDDCLPQPSFFPFCEELLEKYREDERIMLISGDNFQFGRRRTAYSYYFSRYPHTWGWASWRRAWKLMDPDIKLWPEIRDGGWLEDMLADHPRNWGNTWRANFEDVYKGNNSIWDYQWTLACWANSGLTVLPNMNLVSNIGFGADAIHTTGPSPFANLPLEQMTFPLSHPPFVIRDTQADDLTQRTMFGVPPTLKQRILRRLHLGRLARTIRRAVKRNREAAFLSAINHLGNNNLPTAGMSKAFAALKSNQPAEALALLSEDKALHQPVLNLDLFRAAAFVQMQRMPEALEALKEECRLFPNNIEAHAWLKKLKAHAPKPTATVGTGDPEFREVLDLVRPYTMLGEERLYSLFTHAKEICVRNAPGNFAECGVCAGGSLALLAYVVKRYSRLPRRVFGFDTFEGMPAPGQFDMAKGVAAQTTGWGAGTCAANEQSVLNLCARLGAGDLVVTSKGLFQNTLPKIKEAMGMLALVHLDGDWYDSTKTVLEQLYDRVLDKGFIQIDDYEYWEGCRKAVDEFQQNRGVKFVLNRIDGFGVWLIKR